MSLVQGRSALRGAPFVPMMESAHWEVATNGPSTTERTVATQCADDSSTAAVKLERLEAMTASSELIELIGWSDD